MAFWEGMLAGYGIAIPVGAIAILIIDTALRRGFWLGFAAGAGAATADLVYAVLAALAGQTLMGWLAPLAAPLQVISGLVLMGLGGYGLWKLRQATTRSGAEIAVEQNVWSVYRQFTGLTLLNPATIAYFGSLILGGGSANLTTPFSRAAFVAGAAVASFSWQTLLAVFGALARRGLPPRLQLALSVVGNLIVIGLGVLILYRFYASGG